MTTGPIDWDSVQQALALAADLPNGLPVDHVTRVAAWARAAPEAVAKVTVALAAMVVGDGLARLYGVAAPTPEEREAAMRDAHRQFARGVRSAWVVDGERIYQREMKRRLRSRNKEAA